MKFQARPITVEAMQWTGNWKALLAWRDSLLPAGPPDVFDTDSEGGLWIGGKGVAAPNDWVVYGVEGFVPCALATFEKSYKQV
jgi:hypothetical protein